MGHRLVNLTCNCILFESIQKTPYATRSILRLVKKQEQLSNFIRGELVLPILPAGIYLSSVGLVRVSNKGRKSTMPLPKVATKERHCMHDTGVQERA